MDIPEMADAVRSREDFIRFAEALAKECRENGTKWENIDLPSYLGAVSGWTADMDGAFINKGEPVPREPSWQLFARILKAACYYE